MQRAELLPQDGLHPLEGGQAGAVTGVKDRVVPREFPGCLVDDIQFLAVVGLFLHHMESADHDVGVAAEEVAVAVQDVQDAVVGAARHQHPVSVLADHQALLVGEIVLQGLTVPPDPE